MAASIPFTEFAPAERVPLEVIHRQASLVSAVPVTMELLNSVLNYVFILNQQRQIIFASRNFLELTSDKNYEALLGKKTR